MNFKILIVAIVFVLYEANARVISNNEILSRHKRQYDRPYVSALGYPGRPVMASPGGLVNGLITNLTGNLGWTGRAFLTAILGSLGGPMQSIGQAGADIQNTLIGNPNPTYVMGHDFYPHQKPDPVVAQRPPGAPAEPEKRTIDATKGIEDENSYNSNLRSIERKNKQRPGAFGGSLLNYWFVPNRPSSPSKPPSSSKPPSTTSKPPKPSKPSGGSSSSSSSPSSSSSSSSSSDSSSSSSSSSQFSDQQQGSQQQQQQQQQQPALPPLESLTEQFGNILHFGGQLNMPLPNGGNFTGFGQYLQNYQMNSQYGKPNGDERKKQ